MPRILGLVRLKIPIRKIEEATGISQAEAQGPCAERAVPVTGIGRNAEHAFAQQGLFDGVAVMPLGGRIGVGASQGGLIGVRFAPLRSALKHGVKRHEFWRARTFSAGLVKGSAGVADAGKTRVLAHPARPL